jgi:hypothetical protein
MKTEFDLMISFRTPNGFKRCAQYFLGHDRNFAESVFAQLTGSQDQADQAVLNLDLLETDGDVPVKVKTIGCKLSELCGNCEIMTRALFRKHAINDKTGA